MSTELPEYLLLLLWFFVIAAQISFLALSFPFLPALLLPVPSAFHTLSGCCKTLGVSYGQGLEMRP